jgi:putative PIN family toxin of toxin-antitoxin system
LSTTLRVILDTVVFVRALLNPRNHCGRVLASQASAYRLFLSQPVLQEILEVLSRPELARRFSTLDGLNTALVLDWMAQAEVVSTPTVPRVSRDRNDDIFLAAARAARADYLVTEDEDLLVLHAYAGTRIVRCSELVAILEAGIGP